MDFPNHLFYVNKCGFHIMEFFNPHHPEPADHAIRPAGNISSGLKRCDVLSKLSSTPDIIKSFSLFDWMIYD